MISLKSKDWCIDNVETVLFDKDGTFIDLHYFWGKMTELRAEEVILRYGLSDSLFTKLCLFLGYDCVSGKMLSDGITAMYSRPKIIEIFRANLSELGVKTTIVELEQIFDEVSEKFYTNMQEYTKPIPEAIEFINKLAKRGIKLGIVTSDSKLSTDMTLKYFGWENLFGVVVGRESTSETKESGIPTRMALEVLNSNPVTTVMVGDAPMDYISAKNSGILNTILVASGQIAAEELKKTSNYVLNSLSELEIV